MLTFASKCEAEESDNQAKGKLSLQLCLSQKRTKLRS